MILENEFVKQFDKSINIGDIVLTYHIEYSSDQHKPTINFQLANGHNIECRMDSLGHYHDFSLHIDPKLTNNKMIVAKIDFNRNLIDLAVSYEEYQLFWNDYFIKCRS